MMAFKKTIIQAAVVSVPLAVLIAIVWSTTVPVVIFMHPLGPVRHAGASVTGEFTGYKLRDCSPVLGSERGLMKVGGVWYEDIPFEFIDDASPGSSHPARMLSYFGWWGWTTNEPPTHVIMQIDHLCNHRQIVSTYGPFDVVTE